jgi:S1-C subfamily serine protease
VTGHGGVAGLWYRTDPMTGMVESSEVEQAGFYQMPVNGIYVMEVSGNNAKGKVTAGDVITQVNGLNVANTQDLIGAVNRYLAGETVTLTLYRNGETVHVDVVLMEEASS